MSDEFRKMMDMRVGVGGVTCFCCNHFKGKRKPILTRAIRRAFKKNFKKDIDKE